MCGDSWAAHKAVCGDDAERVTWLVKVIVVETADVQQVGIIIS